MLRSLLRALGTVAQINEKLVELANNSNKLVRVFGTVSGNIGKVIAGPIGTALAVATLAYDQFVKRAIDQSERLESKLKDVSIAFSKLPLPSKSRMMMEAQILSAAYQGRGVATRTEFLGLAEKGAQYDLTLKQTGQLIEISKLLAREQGKALKEVYREILPQAQISLLGMSDAQKETAMLQWRARAGRAVIPGMGPRAAYEDAMQSMGTDFRAIGGTFSRYAGRFARDLAGPNYEFEENPLSARFTDIYRGIGRRAMSPLSRWAGSMVAGQLHPYKWLAGKAAGALGGAERDDLLAQLNQIRAARGDYSFYGTEEPASGAELFKTAAYSALLTPFGQRGRQIAAKLARSSKEGKASQERNLREQYSAASAEETGREIQKKVERTGKIYSRLQSEQDELTILQDDTLKEKLALYEKDSARVAEINAMSPEERLKHQDELTDIANRHLTTPSKIRDYHKMVMARPELKKLLQDPTAAKERIGYLQKNVEVWKRMLGKDEDTIQDMIKVQQAQADMGNPERGLGQDFFRGEGNKINLKTLREGMEKAEIEALNYQKVIYDLELKKKKQGGILYGKDLANYKDAQAGFAKKLTETGRDPALVAQFNLAQKEYDQAVRGGATAKQLAPLEEKLAKAESELKESAPYSSWNTEKLKQAQIQIRRFDLGEAAPAMRDLSVKEAAAAVQSAFLEKVLSPEEVKKLTEMIESEEYADDPALQHKVKTTFELAGRKKKLQDSITMTRYQAISMEIDRQSMGRDISRGTRDGYVSGAEAGMYSAAAQGGEFERSQVQRVLQLKEQAYQQEISFTQQYTQLRTQIIRAHYEGVIYYERGKLQGADRRDVYRLGAIREIAGIEQQYTGIGQTIRAGAEWQRQQGMEEQDFRRQQFQARMGAMGIQIPRGLQMQWQMQDIARQEAEFKKRREEQRTQDLEGLGTYERTMSAAQGLGMDPNRLGQSEGGRQFLLEQYGSILPIMARSKVGAGKLKDIMGGVLEKQRGYAIAKMGMGERERSLRAGGIDKELAEIDKQYEGKQDTQEYYLDRAQKLKEKATLAYERGDNETGKAAQAEYEKLFEKLDSKMKEQFGDKQAQIKAEIAKSNKFLETIAKNTSPEAWKDPNNVPSVLGGNKRTVGGPPQPGSGYGRSETHPLSPKEIASAKTPEELLNLHEAAQTSLKYKRRSEEIHTSNAGFNIDYEKGPLGGGRNYLPSQSGGAQRSPMLQIQDMYVGALQRKNRSGRIADVLANTLPLPPGTTYKQDRASAGMGYLAKKGMSAYGGLTMAGYMNQLGAAYGVGEMASKAKRQKEAYNQAKSEDNAAWQARDPEGYAAYQDYKERETPADTSESDRKLGGGFYGIDEETGAVSAIKPGGMGGMGSAKHLKPAIPDVARPTVSAEATPKTSEDPATKMKEAGDTMLKASENFKNMVINVKVGDNKTVGGSGVGSYG